MKYRDKIKSIAQTTINNYRRPSLPVFDRLNVSPCHKSCSRNKESFSVYTSEAKGFGEITSLQNNLCLILKRVKKEYFYKNEKIIYNQNDLLKNLINILDQMDQENPPKEINLDDYKDYLIWKLCKKLKTLMKKKEETPANRYVLDIHQKIAKTLSNIETQLKEEDESEKKKIETKEEDGEISK